MNVRIALGLLLVLLLTPGSTHAKAPLFVQVTIRGPHLSATIVITDRATLDALSMDVLEDFSRAVVLAGPAEPGYELVRYVQGPDDVVRVFDRLRYRANPQAGWCGYIEYLGSESTTQSFYAGKWFFATPQGDAVLQQLLRSRGVPLPGRPPTAAAGCRRYELHGVSWSVIAGLVLPIVIASLSLWPHPATGKITTRQHHSWEAH